MLLLLLSAPIPWSYWGGTGGCPSPPPLCWMGLQFYTFPTIPCYHYTHYTTTSLYPLYNGTAVPTIPLNWMGPKYSTIPHYHYTHYTGWTSNTRAFLLYRNPEQDVGTACCHHHASEFVWNQLRSLMVFIFISFPHQPHLHRNTQS